MAKYLIFLISISCFSCISTNIQSIEERENGVTIQYEIYNKKELDEITTAKCGKEKPYTWIDPVFTNKPVYEIDGSINATVSTPKEESKTSILTAMCYSPESILFKSEQAYLNEQSKICLDNKNLDKSSKYKACQQSIALLNTSYKDIYYDMSKEEKDILLQAYIESCNLDPFKCPEYRTFKDYIEQKPEHFIKTKIPNDKVQELIEYHETKKEVGNFLQKLAWSGLILGIMIIAL